MAKMASPQSDVFPHQKIISLIVEAMSVALANGVNFWDALDAAKEQFERKIRWQNSGPSQALTPGPRKKA